MENEELLQVLDKRFEQIRKMRPDEFSFVSQIFLEEFWGLKIIFDAVAPLYEELLGLMKDAVKRDVEFEKGAVSVVMSKMERVNISWKKIAEDLAKALAEARGEKFNKRMFEAECTSKGSVSQAVSLRFLREE